MCVGWDLLAKLTPQGVGLYLEFSMITGAGYNYEAIRLRVKNKELEQYAFQRNKVITVIEI